MLIFGSAEVARGRRPIMWCDRCDVGHGYDDSCWICGGPTRILAYGERIMGSGFFAARPPKEDE